MRVVRFANGFHQKILLADLPATNYQLPTTSYFSNDRRIALKSRVKSKIALGKCYFILYVTVDVDN